jgi:hypothetical protein
MADPGPQGIAFDAFVQAVGAEHVIQAGQLFFVKELAEGSVSLLEGMEGRADWLGRAGPFCEAAGAPGAVSIVRELPSERRCARGRVGSHRHSAHYTVGVGTDWSGETADTDFAPDQRRGWAGRPGGAMVLSCSLPECANHAHDGACASRRFGLAPQLLPTALT